MENCSIVEKSIEIEHWLDKQQMQNELRNQFKTLWGLWVLENIQQKGSWCIDRPEWIGKTKKELARLFPDMQHQSIESFFYGLFSRKEADAILANLNETRRKKPQGVQWFPVTIGMDWQEDQFIIISFDQDGCVKDAFCIGDELDYRNTFSPALRLVFEDLFTLVEQSGLRIRELFRGYDPVWA